MAPGSQSVGLYRVFNLHSLPTEKLWRFYLKYRSLAFLFKILIPSPSQLHVPLALKDLPPFINSV